MRKYYNLVQVRAILKEQRKRLERYLGEDTVSNSWAKWHRDLGKWHEKRGDIPESNAHEQAFSAIVSKHPRAAAYSERAKKMTEKLTGKSFGSNNNNSSPSSNSPTPKNKPAGKPNLPDADKTTAKWHEDMGDWHNQQESNSNNEEEKRAHKEARLAHHDAQFQFYHPNQNSQDRVEAAQNAINKTKKTLSLGQS